MKLVLILLLLIAIIVFLPVGLIWSLNTLFGLTIVFTFKTWLAALLLLSFMPRGYSKS